MDTETARRMFDHGLISQTDLDDIVRNSTLGPHDEPDPDNEPDEEDLTRLSVDEHPGHPEVAGQPAPA